MLLNLTCTNDILFEASWHIVYRHTDRHCQLPGFNFAESEGLYSALCVLISCGTASTPRNPLSSALSVEATMLEKKEEDAVEVWGCAPLMLNRMSRTEKQLESRDKTG